MHSRVESFDPEHASGNGRATTHSGDNSRYAIVTPVRDEEKYIGAMIESIAAQTIPPVQWVIVDDGSRDRTAAILREYSRKLQWIHLITLQPREQRLAGGEGAIPTGLRNINVRDLDYLARLDADLVFPPDYFARIFEKFRAQPALGIAGGVLYIEKKGKLVAEKDAENHVRGALKLYRLKCLLEIGGLSTEIGWDTLDEISAMAHGWKTQSFDDLVVIHRRPTGEGIAASRVFRQRGRGEYLTWSDPLFVFGKAVKIAFTEVSVLKPTCYLWGYLRSCALREARIQNGAIAKVRRAVQRNRMAKILRPFTKRSRETDSQLSSS